MAGQGSAGNVIAAVCSFFVPGLGQLVQGRLGMAILQFVLAVILWFFSAGVGDSPLVDSGRGALESSACFRVSADPRPHPEQPLAFDDLSQLNRG